MPPRLSRSYLEWYLGHDDKSYTEEFDKWVQCDERHAQEDAAIKVLGENRYGVILDQSTWPGELHARIPHRFWIRYALDRRQKFLSESRHPEVRTHLASEPLEGMKINKFLQYKGMRKLNLAMRTASCVEDSMAMIGSRSGKKNLIDVLFDWADYDGSILQTGAKMQFVPYRYLVSGDVTWYMCLMSSVIRPFIGYSQLLNSNLGEVPLWHTPDAHLLAMDIAQISGIEQSDCRLLDLGCGTGRLANVAPWSLYTGIDSYSGITAKPSGKRNFVIGKIEENEFAGRYDVAVCIDVLNYIEQPFYLFRWIIKHTPASKIIFRVMASENETKLIFHPAVCDPIGWKFPRTKWKRFISGHVCNFAGSMIDGTISNNQKYVYLVIE